jgi:cbb3-type cytochrome oxidase subunit 3
MIYLLDDYDYRPRTLTAILLCLYAVVFWLFVSRRRPG